MNFTGSFTDTRESVCCETWQLGAVIKLCYYIIVSSGAASGKSNILERPEISKVSSSNPVQVEAGAGDHFTKPFVSNLSGRFIS